MRRIMKILGIVTIVALLLGGGAVAPVVATQGLQLASMPPLRQHMTATLRLISILVSKHRESEGNIVVIGFRRLPIEGLRLSAELIPATWLIDSTTIPVDIYDEISSGTYRVVQNVPGLSGVSGSGYLAVLHFHVIGSEGDSSTISLSNGMLSNNLAEEIPATWVGDSVNVTSVLPRDANGDGGINTLDITKVERIIATLDAETPGADANQDGNVNALDITKTERIICRSG